MPYPTTRDGIRRRFADSGLQAIPDDQQCDALIELTRLQSLTAGRPVDVVGQVIKKLRTDVAVLKARRDR